MIPEDKPSLAKIALLHPKLRDEARAIYDEIRAADLSIRFTFSLRTIAEQNKLYAQGRTTKGPVVTNAKGGLSWHNYGLALDFCLLLDGGKKASWDTKYDGPDAGGHPDWMEVVAIFKKHGWEWGGDFNSIVDPPHVQKRFGLGIRDALARYNAGKVQGGYIIL